MCSGFNHMCVNILWDSVIAELGCSFDFFFSQKNKFFHICHLLIFSSVCVAHHMNIKWFCFSLSLVSNVCLFENNGLSFFKSQENSFCVLWCKYTQSNEGGDRNDDDDDVKYKHSDWLISVCFLSSLLRPLPECSHHTHSLHMTWWNFLEINYFCSWKIIEKKNSHWNCFRLCLQWI